MDIAVITHAQDKLFRELAGHHYASDYLLGPIPWELSGMGHSIEVYRGVPETAPPADLAIMHVDLTRVPAEYLDFGATFPACVNLAAVDISKRAVSEALLDGTEAWDGPVIVKSDWNFGGRAELRLVAAVRRQHQEPAPPVRPSFNYRIYDSLEAVPDAVRDDPGLVIEKFLPKRDGDHYVTRFYLFAGASEHCARVHANEPIVKGSNALGFEFCEIPPLMRERRAALGIDFGKLDFVMHDGEPVLIDANKTPATMPVTPESKWPRIYAEALAAWTG